MGKNDLDIIYEDNHIIVVNKKRGILTQSDITQDMDLLQMIKDYIKKEYEKPGNVYIGMVQRLDRVTSGAIVFAKTSKAASRLSDIIRKKELDKTYLAIVEGVLEEKKAILTDYLIKDEKNNISKITKNKEKGKIAILEYEVIAEKNNLSLLKVNLKTGRSHQIRVQLSSRGYIILGDKKYGSKIPLKDGITLHSYNLGFIHPVKKEYMEFKANIQNDEYFNLFDIR